MEKNNFELDDFIVEELEIVAGAKIDPKSQLANFAKIKVAAIDPKIHKEIGDALNRIEKNLEKLKNSVQF
jgi:hypothetical protein